MPLRKLLLVLALLLSSPTTMTQASSMILSSAQQVYRYGDTMRIVAHVTNTENVPVRMYIEHTLRDLQGRFATDNLLNVVDLLAREATPVMLYDVTVGDQFYNGQYVLQASLVVNNVSIGEAELSFTVEGVPEDMGVMLQLSPDPDYRRTGHVFVLGEKVYIGLTGAPQEAFHEAKLKLPDNSTQVLTLPLALAAKQVGAYEVSVNVSATGYRDARLRDSFTVLEESPQSPADSRGDSGLSITLGKIDYKVGEMVTVSGELSPPHSGASVALSYSLNAAVETTRIVTTDDDGLFSDTYEPAKDGEWGVAASWAGDFNHLGAESPPMAFSVEAPPTNWLPAVIASFVVLVGLAMFLKRRGRK